MPTVQVDLKVDLPLLAQSTLITHAALALGSGILMEKEVEGTWRKGAEKRGRFGTFSLENDR